MQANVRMPALYQVVAVQEGTMRAFPDAQISTLVPGEVLGRRAWADYTPSAAEVRSPSCCAPTELQHLTESLHALSPALQAATSAQLVN